MSNPHIVLNNIQKEFIAAGEAITALRDINLTVDKGEYVSIIGHSGSGKSTLLSVVGGILAPTRGHLIVQGEDIYHADENGLARYRAGKVGFVFQSASLLPSLTVMENMLFPTIFAADERRDQKRDEALTYLRRVDLRSKAEVYPYQLSGGEARRVSLIRALMNKPEILLADEPTGDLDEDTEKVVMDLLQQFHEEFAITFILVTHNEELAKKADRKLVMKKGTLAENL
jgi:ABC-type lipoprotein export system ATPase subunit